MVKKVQSVLNYSKQKRSKSNLGYGTQDHYCVSYISDQEDCFIIPQNMMTLEPLCGDRLSDEVR